MKTACLFAAAALSGAVAPPKISLNLEGMSSAYQLKESIVRKHDLGYLQNNGEKVTSQQDWTEKCAAVKSWGLEGEQVKPTSSKNCPFPVARAYDHHSGVVDVKTRVYRVDLDGTPQVINVNNQIKLTKDGSDFQNVDMWNHRSTFLFKYDAKDAAGNHADQVVFALILDDTSRPQFDQKTGTKCKQADFEWHPSITVEAVSDWTLCKHSVTDNVDSSTSTGLQKKGQSEKTDVKYQVTYLGRDHPFFEGKNPSHPKPWWHSNSKLAVNWAGFGRRATSGLSYEGAAALFNLGGYGPDRVGKFLVTASINDFANVYGHNNVNNVNEITTAILVRDTSAPVIYLDGHNPEMVECHSKNVEKESDCNTGKDGNCYVEPGAAGHDKLDTEALKQFLPVTITMKGVADNTIEKTQKSFWFKDLSNKLTKLQGNDKCKSTRTINYNAKDYAENAAPQVPRTVNTVDTITPAVKLIGSSPIVFSSENCKSKAACEAADHHKGNLDNMDPGATCSDLCDTGVAWATNGGMSWGPRTFNARVLGNYVRTYSCSDKCGNTGEATRTFTVVDPEEPKITIQGTPNMTLEANRDLEYTDSGALCSDWVDGELSHAVEVSGEVVNMRIPGKYTIQYNCQDLSGNEAETVKRVVVVRDTTRPTMSLNGATVNYIEAGFPYIDAGASATDTLDGDITQYIWTDGDTVDDQRAFYAYHSCKSMQKATKKKLNNGEYYITTKTPQGKFIRQLVHCVFSQKSTYGYKIVQQKSTAAAYCPTIGMAPIKPNAYMRTVTSPSLYAKLGNEHTFACRDNGDNTVDVSDKTFGKGILSDQISDAEQGKYVIQFHVEDKAGNKQCNNRNLKCLKRTVIVKDTLPPVLSLSYKKRRGEQMAMAQGKNVAETDMSVHGHNNYMAEASSTSNGFIVGAIASAVAGVALLGVSMRKSSTTVPV